MWSGWAVALADGLDGRDRAADRGARSTRCSASTRRPADVTPGGGLAATPMARMRDRDARRPADAGPGRGRRGRALEAAWHAPDPVALARPLTDLPALFERLRPTGRRIAVATSDDRDPTERTLAAARHRRPIDALVCADDGIAVKPAPDMVLHLCAPLGVAPARTAVVGDSPADLRDGPRRRRRPDDRRPDRRRRRADLEPLADAVIASIAELQVGVAT